jgi:hypothetical protein
METFITLKQDVVAEVVDQAAVVVATIFSVTVCAIGAPQLLRRGWRITELAPIGGR